MLISLKRILTLIAWLLLFIGCHSQDNQEQNRSFELLGGPCEGCEAIFEYDNQLLTPIDTLPDFDKQGPRMKVTGTIYYQDGKTPAADIILYIYHTNGSGIYPKKGNETGWAKRHGYIRGWIRTNAEGKYAFFTLRPGAYPERLTPEHIHATILDDKGYYYIDDYLFDDDPLLTPTHRNSRKNKGGSGIIELKEENGMLITERDITLGLNISNY